MTAKVSKVYRAAEVCEAVQIQSYVLRSWEKEFPGIGVQTAGDGPRLYRQSDVDQVMRIKGLVFGEGLTVSGARRRLEETGLVSGVSAEGEAAEVLKALGSDARVRIASVRDGLRSLLRVLSSAPGAAEVVADFQLEPPVAGGSGKSGKKSGGSGNTARGVVAPARTPRLAASEPAGKSKRSRASA